MEWEKKEDLSQPNTFNPPLLSTEYFLNWLN